MENHDFRIEEGFSSDIGHGDGHQVWNDVYLLHQGLGAVNQAGQVILGKAGRCNQYGVDAGFLYHFFHISKATQHGESMEHYIHRMAVFQEPHHPVSHAGVVKNLPHHQLRRLPGAYDEHGNLEGLHLLHGFAEDDPDNGKEYKGYDQIGQDKEPGHLPRYLGKEHEDNGKHSPFQARKEKALHHAVDEHAPSVKSAIENKKHKYHRQPEEKVEQRDMENTVCHDAVPKENR